jgi:hypothetical protein
LGKTAVKRRGIVICDGFNSLQASLQALAWFVPLILRLLMLKITLHDSSQELRFKLEGKLSGPWVRELHQCWQTAASTTRGRSTVIDLGEVDFVDPEGQSLLADMHRNGVRLLALTPLIQSLVGEVCGGGCCGTVEEKRPHSHDAFVSTDTTGRNPRAL